MKDQVKLASRKNLQFGISKPKWLSLKLLTLEPLNGDQFSLLYIPTQIQISKNYFMKPYLNSKFEKK